MIKIKLKFLVFLVLIAIFAYLGGGNLPYTILYSVVLVLVLGIIHIILQRVTMKINLDVGHDIFKTGDVLSLKILVKSFSAFPAAYMLVENSAVSNFKKNYNGNIAFFNYHKEKCFSNDLELKVRGVYDFSKTNILFTDLFCIMKINKHFAREKFIKVYPRVYGINEENFKGKNILQDAFKNIAISEESNEIRDLRLYRDGDSLKKVHWKLSAKHNELYVKNFSAVVSRDTNIILNMNKEDEEDYDLIEEQMIDLSVSLINYLQSKKFKIKLFINNEEEKAFNIANHGDFQLIMEYFLNNKSQGEVDLITFLDSKVTILEQRSFIGIITLVVDEALINKIMALVNIGFKISVFYYRDNNLAFINDQKGKGLEFIKWEKAIFSLDE